MLQHLHNLLLLLSCRLRKFVFSNTLVLSGYMQSIPSLSLAHQVIVADVLRAPCHHYADWGSDTSSSLVTQETDGKSVLPELQGRSGHCQQQDP